ncbi:hypothetical protein HK44_004465 [Pseudomonas fluorescens HK44]|uniref:Uncharacterized protein n=1 Tax=Pseudomonas fluorescens HK44 TaxID=1042209 RepID=A0A010SIT1_PSEFL|nr:hypothetical protein HK44_004465 [Pseudomonas fluorescens HK44]
MTTMAIAVTSKMVIAVTSKVGIAITSKVFTAQSMVSNSPAVMIGFLAFSATIALGTRRMTFTRVSATTAAAAISAATAATAATATISATISATITTAVTTTFFGIGRTHDRQPGGEQRRGSKHQYTRHNCG